MTEISERQARDIANIADMLTEQLVTASLRFCAYHGMKDAHDAPLASLILLESITLNVLIDAFTTDQARHETLRKMEKAMHKTLRQTVLERAGLQPPGV